MKLTFAKIAGGTAAGALLLGIAAKSVDGYLAPQACGLDPDGTVLVLENTGNTPRVTAFEGATIQSGRDSDFCVINGRQVNLRPDLYTWVRAQGIAPSVK